MGRLVVDGSADDGNDDDSLGSNLSLAKYCNKLFELDNILFAQFSFAFVLFEL